MTLDQPLRPEERIDLFKFYESAAQTAKETAWTQTAWVLTLNAGVIGFAFDLFIRRPNESRIFELFAASVGVVLCVYLYWSLSELGTHIDSYWRAADFVADAHPPLRSVKEAMKDHRKPENPPRGRFGRWWAGLPAFIRRLQLLPIGFFLAHAVWFLYLEFVAGTS